jgi:hypothetical protein
MDPTPAFDLSPYAVEVDLPMTARTMEEQRAFEKQECERAIEELYRRFETDTGLARDYVEAHAIVTMGYAHFSLRPTKPFPDGWVPPAKDKSP